MTLQHVNYHNHIHGDDEPGKTIIISEDLTAIYDV